MIGSVGVWWSQVVFRTKVTDLRDGGFSSISNRERDEGEKKHVGLIWKTAYFMFLRC